MRTSSISIARAVQVYRAGGLRRANARLNARDLSGKAFSAKPDIVQFSTEALEKAKLLKKEQTEESNREDSPRREKDANILRSLGMLDLHSNASAEEIRSAYLFLLRNYHPDKYAHLPPEFRELAETRCRQIIDAYERLTG